MVEERFYTYDKIGNLLSTRLSYQSASLARGVFLMGDKGSSASYGSRYNFNPLGGLGLASTNYTSNGDSPYVVGNFGPPANGGHGYSGGSFESGTRTSSTNYQGPQSFNPLSGLTTSSSQQVTGVTSFVRGFTNIGHTYSGPYSETLINYTYPTNHVRPHAVSSRSNGDTYTYDANGNMIVRVQSGVTYCQTFDAENRLVKVETLSNSDCANKTVTTTTSYVYDGEGNRVKRTVGTTGTIYVAGMEIELHSGTEDHRTIYYAAGGAFRIVGGSNAGLYFRHTDHLGSTSVLSDSSGNKVANSDVVYAPFGETRVGSLSTLTDFGFTGQRVDRSTDGLMYYGARYYLPGLNRFISPDTIVPGTGDPQNLNRFSYTRNNPVNRIDPTGHRDCDKLPGDCGKPVDTSGPAPRCMVSNSCNKPHSDPDNPASSGGGNTGGNGGNGGGGKGGGGNGNPGCMSVTSCDPPGKDKCMSVTSCDNDSTQYKDPFSDKLVSYPLGSIYLGVGKFYYYYSRDLVCAGNGLDCRIFITRALTTDSTNLGLQALSDDLLPFSTPYGGFTVPFIGTGEYQGEEIRVRGLDAFTGTTTVVGGDISVISGDHVQGIDPNTLESNDFNGWAWGLGFGVPLAEGHAFTATSRPATLVDLIPH